MVTINVTGSSVEFTFQNSPYYLSNGTITVPKNSLALTIDSSDMVTYKKAASNDIFISVPLSELDMTKEEVVEQFYSMCTTGGSESGVTSGEVETMIEEAISGKADSSAVTEEITAAVSGKADTSAVTDAIDASEYVTAQALIDLNTRKPDSSAVTAEITAAVSGKADSSAVTASINAAVSGKADTSAVTAAIDDSEYVTAQALIDLNTRKPDSSAVTAEITAAVSGKCDTSALTNYYTSGQTDSAITAAVSGKVDTSAVTTAITSGSTDSQVPSAKAVYDQLGGVKIVALSQQAYDALAPNYDANTLYIINS